METLLTLEELGARLARVDTLMMVLAKRRMELALQVGTFKRHANQKIFRADVEDKRIAKIKEWAAEHGLNPNFAATLLYLLIDESCKQQMIQLQEESLSAEPGNEDEWYEGLKKNLLLLTEQCAGTYDNEYEEHAFGTKAYLDFERSLIEREVAQLPDRSLVVDLGCATGKLTLPLCGHFERALGYDLSQHMIVVARESAKSHEFGSRATFEQVDVENGIPIEDATASFVVMSLGTASDVRDIQKVIKETMRVLMPGGRFLFSFYNRDALLYRWEFLPWPVGLAASINLHKHCLEVHSGRELLSVYARPYSMAEVEALFREAGVSVSMSTYPTMSAILPNELVEDQFDVQASVVSIDTGLASSSMGAYIIASGQK